MLQLEDSRSLFEQIGTTIAARTKSNSGSPTHLSEIAAVISTKGL